MEVKDLLYSIEGGRGSIELAEMASLVGLSCPPGISAAYTVDCAPSRVLLTSIEFSSSVGDICNRPT